MFPPAVSTFTQFLSADPPTAAVGHCAWICSTTTERRARNLLYETPLAGENAWPTADILAFSFPFSFSLTAFPGQVHHRPSRYHYSAPHVQPPRRRPCPTSPTAGMPNLSHVLRQFKRSPLPVQRSTTEYHGAMVGSPAVPELRNTSTAWAMLASSRNLRLRQLPSPNLALVRGHGPRNERFAVVQPEAVSMR